MMHLEHCQDCDHRNCRRCHNPEVAPFAFLPPVRWRRRGLELVPMWCPLGPVAWPEDDRNNGT